MADGQTGTPAKQFSPFLRQLFPISGILLNVIMSGCMIGYPSVLLPQLKNTSFMKLDKDAESWIASISGIGILNGNLMVPFFLAYVSRRMANTLSSVPGFIGWVLIIFADDVTLFLIGRYLQGVCMGIQAPVSSISIGEYSSPSNRGGFLASISFSLAIGMLVVHSCGTVMSWKNTAMLSMTFSVLSTIIILTAPETPMWLLYKQKYEKCKEVFLWLRGNGIQDEKELDIMIERQIYKQNMNEETDGNWFEKKIKILKQPSFYKPISIVLILFILSQFAGTNTIPTYSATIMEAVLKGGSDSNAGTIAIDIVRFLATLTSLFTLRRFKIRTVLFTSCAFSLFAVIFTATYLYLRELGIITLKHNWIPATSIAIYVFSLTSGIYIIPFNIIGELFPLAYKSLGGLFSGMIIATTFFIAVKTSPHLFVSIGVHGFFYIIGIFIVICSIILYLIVPETKGKTLTEIEDFFTKKV